MPHITSSNYERADNTAEHHTPPSTVTQMAHYAMPHTPSRRVHGTHDLPADAMERRRRHLQQRQRQRRRRRLVDASAQLMFRTDQRAGIRNRALVQYDVDPDANRENIPPEEWDQLQETQPAREASLPPMPRAPPPVVQQPPTVSTTARAPRRSLRISMADHIRMRAGVASDRFVSRRRLARPDTLLREPTTTHRRATLNTSEQRGSQRGHLVSSIPSLHRG